MTKLSGRSSKFFMALSCLSTMALVACSPGKDSKGSSSPSPGPVSSPTTTINPLSEAAAKCEDKIRKLMEAKNMTFESIPELANEIALAQRVRAEVNSPHYVVVESASGITQVSLRFEKRGPTTHFFEYELSVPQEGADSFFNLTIADRVFTSTQSLIINQKFTIDSSCVGHRSMTSAERVVQTGTTDYQYKKDSYFPNGETDSKKDSFSLASPEFIYNFDPAADDISTMRREGHAYLSGVGLIATKYSPAPVRNIKKFGFDLSLEQKIFSASMNDQNLFQISVGEDRAKKISFYEIAGRFFWTVPQVAWQASKMGGASGNSSEISYQLPKDYFVDHSAVLLTTSKIPSYEHFAAYWKILEQSKDEQTNLFTLHLSQVDQPTIHDNSSALDLESNDTIQTDLPAIQAIAKDIIRAQPTDRMGQIQMILDYLDEHYKFDEAMLNNNVIRSLSTKEALERGTGVCQHYAVIYAAVARALKIPTRIVVGYLMTGSAPGGHAWNESEIQPGLWRVIEPQSKQALNQTTTRFYLPTARARFLEDAKISQADYIGVIFNLDYTLKPAP